MSRKIPRSNVKKCDFAIPAEEKSSLGAILTS